MSCYENESCYKIQLGAGHTCTWWDLLQWLRDNQPSATVPLRLSPGVDWSSYPVANLALEVDGLRVWMPDEESSFDAEHLYVEERDETGVWQARGCFMDPDDVEDLMTAEDKALLDRVAGEAWSQANIMMMEDEL